MARDSHEHGAAMPRPGNAVVKLNPAEVEVVARLARGLTNREIAAELGKSIGTVKNQLSSVYRKLGVRNRLQLLSQLRT